MLERGRAGQHRPDAPGPRRLAGRQGGRRSRGHNYNSGAIWKFAQPAGPAYLGATTHPGAAEETHVYADI